MISLNSALHWWPRLKEVEDQLPSEVNLPSTEIVRFDFRKSWELLDGERPEELPVNEVLEAADQLGYPVFIRTDQSSAKHRGPDGYKLSERSSDEFFHVLRNLVEANVAAWRYPAALMVRQWLDLEVSDAFRAFDGAVIGQERRFFSTPEEVVCSHYYWTEESIRFNDGVEEPSNWRGAMQSMSSEGVPDALGKAACVAAEAVSERDGYRFGVPWSVDFAETSSGEWFLIDMATAAESAHPSGRGCGNNFGQHRGQG